LNFFNNVTIESNVIKDSLRGIVLMYGVHNNLIIKNNHFLDYLGSAVEIFSGDW